MRLRVAFVCLLVACGGKPSVSVPGGPTLGVAPPAGSAPLEGPLTVTYHAPIGETHGGQLEISASFDRPMVELGADAPPEGTVTIEPAVPGRARWVGSQTLMFEPSAPLPMGSEFRVRIANLRALDGKSLAEPLEFAFATPALELTHYNVHQDPSQKRKTPFELWFNAPVDGATVAQSLTLQASGKPVEFAVEPDKDDRKRVRVLPKTAYPIGARIELTVRGGLAGVEGPRPLPKDEVVALQVYSPLRVLPNPPCSDEDCVPMLRFSNPVKTKDAFARLVFDPPVPKYQHNEDYVTDQLYFGEELAPGTTYTVRVEGPLKDVYGTQLGKERSAVVRTPPFPALAQLLVTGDQRPGGTGPVRAQLQHLDAAQLELFPLAFEEVLPNALEQITPRAKPVRKTYGEVGPVERKVVEIDAKEALPSGKGLVLAVLTGKSKRDPYEQRKLLAYGDLAPSLKIGERDGVVWVTRLDSAQPVAGARVRVVRGTDTLAQGVSDARGVFAFQFSPVRDDYGDRGDVAAVVEKDGELAFTQKYSGVGPWEVSDRGTWGGDGATRAHLFTERGIYRPGDTVQLKGILRDADAHGLRPSAGEITLHVVDAADAEVETVTLPLSAYGSFARAIRVPGSVELGPLSMKVAYGEQTFSEWVEIAEYRPAELEAKLTASRELALKGEEVQAKLGASYLFGAPAGGAHVYWSARYLSRAFSAPGFEGFTFHDRDREVGSSVAGSGEGELDARGELTLTTKLTDVPPDGPSSLEFESSINVDSTQLSARTQVDVLPASVVVGVRPGSSVLEHDKPFEAELIALDPDGKPRAGVALEATFSRRSWSYEQGQLTPHDTRASSCKLKSADKPVRCALATKEPGLYVVRARGKDSAGRVSSAGEYVYVWGEGPTSWGEQDERVITLHSDRPTYKLGETAKILVPSPFQRAEALVTVEREGVMSSERVQLGSAGTIEIAIDQRFVPNAFVSVLLVRPLGDEKDGLPYRVGTLELSADVSDRKLKIDVQPDAVEKRPGEEVTVTLAVKDAAGKPVQSELTVFAVDEGVLTLTGYHTPDPFAAIYAPHGLSVWTSDARGSLQRLLSAADENKGGDEGGGGGGEVMRSNFSAVAAYFPALETDAWGRAAVRFKLPDSTTKFRVMAVAASRDSKLGSGEASVRTKKPLMMRPLLPRVMRAGDAMSAGVVVHNETDAAMHTRVAIEAKGLAVDGEKARQLDVPAHAAVQVRWSLRAERVGKVSLAFRASAGNERDGLSFEREVLSPSVMETMSIAGATPKAVQEALAPLNKLRDDVGGLKVALSASALVDLEAPARALFAYRFGCTEQLSSRLIALAALERLRKPLALDDGSFTETAAPILSELEKHQGADGGFGLWRADDSSAPWLTRFLTAYALITFDQLERAGIPTSPHAKERARAYLVRGLRDELPFEDRAFLVYALARTGTLELGYANKLFEQRGQLSLLGRIELAHALTRLDARPQAQTVLDELGSHVRVATDRAHLESSRWTGAFDSDVRATGELLEMLLDHAPEHVLVPKLARWLSAARGRDGGYVNTQESAWAVMSLADYLTKREAVPPALKATVKLGAKQLGTFALSGHRASARTSLAMNELPRTGAPLVFGAEGRGTLYYGVQLEYAPLELPRAPVERGFFVERTFERLDPLALARGETKGEPGERAKLHDYVRVTLRIAVPSAREFVMIEDALPAGLEPVDGGLSSEFSAASRALKQRDPEDHRELREQGARIAINDLPPGLYRYSYLARATTPGTFVAPPARVEEMYHPDTQGLTAATTFTVEAP
ncbi:MAG: alpha-2-macroglobulin family protein [Polyangiales bacterium]